MSWLKRFATVLLVLFCALRTLAQNDDCELTLNRALDEFNSGHFYLIPSVLNPCLGQFTNEQSQRAYLLLTQTYLLLDDPIGAKQSYLSLLNANPEFETDTALHSIDVIYLSKRFTATSIFSWFAKAGSNVAMPRMIHDLSAFGEPSVTEQYFLNPGYQASFGADFVYSDKLNLRGELTYSLSSFRHESRNHWTQDFKEVTERQNWISLPLTVVYSDPVGKYRPYGYLGYSLQYLLADKSSIIVRNNRPVVSSDDGDREDISEESPTFDMLYKRNRLNQSIVVGGGLKVKIGLDYIFIDLRYTIGLKNITSTKGLYGNYRTGPATTDEIINSFEPSLRFGDVDDLFRLDNLSLSFGFLHPLYKPRELKRPRTRSVLRKMKK